MARAALGMTMEQFGRLVGLSANTISHIENAHVTLSRTIDGIEEALRDVAAIEWLPDTGESIGIRLHYSRLNDHLERAPRIYGIKRGRGVRRQDPDEIERGKFGSDYPLGKLMEEYSDDLERFGRDKRIGKRSKVDAGDGMAEPTKTISVVPAESIVISKAPPEQRIADGENPIRAWREYRSMSLTTLAKKIEISKGFLSQIENGKRSASVELHYKIAHALGIEPGAIAPGLLTYNEVEPVPAASVPVAPIEHSSDEQTDFANEADVASPPTGPETTTAPSAPPLMSPDGSIPLATQRYYYGRLARQAGVPVEEFLEAMREHHLEREIAGLPARKPKRK
jgi:transcriptional regulator with XRE-family HTH domain